MKTFRVPKNLHNNDNMRPCVSIKQMISLNNYIVITNFLWLSLLGVYRGEFEANKRKEYFI